jgi:ferritin-like protein
MGTTKFQKGASGNPKGRPKGSKNQATLLAIAALEGELDAVVRKVIEAAKGGDMVAARLVVDKLIPAAKTRPMAFQLPTLADISGCRQAQASVIAAVAAGDLLPDEGEQLSTLIEHQRKGLEAETILVRLTAIEERLDMQGGRK